MTFAIPKPLAYEANVKSKAPLALIFSSSPLILVFDLAEARMRRSVLSTLVVAAFTAGLTALAFAKGCLTADPHPGAAVQSRLQMVAATETSIAGRWFSQYMQVMIEEGADRNLTLKQARPDDLNSFVGEVVGEAKPSGDGVWTGRHAWGGERTHDRTWGQWGGLLIQRNSPDEIFIQYKDSKYTGGWTLVRQ